MNALDRAFSIAGRQIGLNENEQSAALTEFLRNGGENLDPQTTAWCAAFVNSALEQGGLEGTGKLNARSYLDWGQEVSTPRRGDIAVFSRGDPNGWQGHVGFFDGYNEDGTIRVLGGNQSNSVSIADYSPDRLLGFRRAEGAPVNAMGGAPMQPEMSPPIVAEMAEPPQERNALQNYAPTQLDAGQFMIAPKPVNQLSLV